MEIIRLTKASDEDAFVLSTIAYEAKAFWDYPQAWLDLWKKDLTLQADFINQHLTFLIRNEKEILGFCLIISEKNFFDIEHCWISPKHIGQGLGKTLLTRVLALKAFQNQKFQVLSDPNALGFYQKFGFKVIQQIESLPKGRLLPLMQMTNKH